MSVEAPDRKPAAKPGAFVPAILAVALPVAAFALAWIIAAKIPFAVPTREWGTWFVIGPLLGLAGITGLVFVFRAFTRGGQRTLAVAGVILNALVILTAWAGLFG